MNLLDEALLEHSPEILAAAQEATSNLLCMYLRSREKSISNVTRCFSVGELKKV
jgi:hypothetical protein